MNIPTFIHVQYVTKDGYLTHQMNAYHDDLNQTLQAGLSDKGWTLPRLTTAQITSIAGQMPNGTMWYDTDTNEPKIKVAGVVRIIQLV